jgi:uncharacterized membrane protein
MERIERSIEVRCPLRTVYTQWTRFEEFPEFMSGVLEVRQVDDTHVHCQAEIWGEEKEVDAEIVEHVPNHHIAWKSMSVTPSAGIVNFESLGPQLTRVKLVIAYEPSGAADDGLDALESLGIRLQETVEDFKWFIESVNQGNGARTDVGTGDSNAGGVAGDWPHRSGTKKH